MAAYAPPVFTPAGVLELLHNSPRIKGDNQVFIPENFELSTSSPEGEYLIGIGAGPAIMWAVFIIWLFALCCVGCCKRQCCGNKSASILFTAFMVLSCFGWFYSIGANVKGSNGVDLAFDQAGNLIQVVEETVADARAVVNFVTTLDTQSGVAASACAAILNATNETFPTTDFSAITADMTTVVDDLEVELNSVKSELDSVVSSAEPYMENYKLAFTILIACIIALTGIFTISTLLRVLPNAPGRDNKCVACISKVSGTCFLSVGVLLLLLIWILIGIMAVITTIGADLCVPSPSANIRRLAEELSAESRAPGVAFCDEQPFSFLCYYQSCEGENPLQSQVGDVLGFSANATQLIDEIADSVNASIEAIENATGSVPPGAAECQESIVALQTEVGKVDALLDDVLDVAECSVINPIYAATVNDALCNGVVAGLATMWVTMALGAASLMAAMIVYRIFKFDRFENGVYVDEYYDAQDAQVIAHGSKEF